MKAFVALGFTTVLTSGCGMFGSKAPPPPPPPPPPAQIDGSISATATVNPSVSQRPSPVLLRVYELKNANTFSSADFIALYQRDQAELGADVVARDEMMLNPGESKPLTRTLSNDTHFIAVFAAFRDIERAQWRSVLAVKPNQKQRVVIRADGLVVSVTN
jgi:type VI secretion system protein VasD